MRVAVVGTGRMGEAHARAWASLQPDVELAAAVGQRESRPLEAAPDVPVTTDLERVLADPTIGIVSICTPTDTHLELTRRALDAGKHVLLEKPLARTAEEGAALVELAARASSLLMVAHVVRFFPGYVAVRDLVQRGELGRVDEVAAERLSATGGRPPWLDDEARSGGVLLDLAVHDFDQLVLLLGAAQRVEAHETDGGVVEAVVQHEHGGVGRVRAGWDLPADFPFTTSLSVRGDAGSARYAFAAGVTDPGLLEVRTGGEPYSSTVESGDPYASQAAYFLGCVQHALVPEQGNVVDAFAALRLALAARTALLDGGVVEVP